MEISGFRPFSAQKNAILDFSVAQISKSCKEHYHKLDFSDQNEHSTDFIRQVVHKTSICSLSQLKTFADNFS